MNQFSNRTKSKADNLALDSLLPALQSLDHLLESAIAAAEKAYGPDAATDLQRGLYLSTQEVLASLSRKPADPLLQPETGDETLLAGTISQNSPLFWLQQTFELSPFDLYLCLIALAPELDLRYERLYAYLQDDVTRKRPTVDLALNLLCPDAAAKLERRVHFDPEAPLIRHQLLHLIPDPHQVQPPLLSHFLKLDEPIVRFLLGHPGLDRRLADCCQWVQPAVSSDSLLLPREIQQALGKLAGYIKTSQRPVRLYFQGSPHLGQRAAAAALAAELGRPLLAVNLVLALGQPTDFGQLLQLFWRQAALHEAVLYFEGLDDLRRQDRAIPYGQLRRALSEEREVAILVGVQPWLAAGSDSLDAVVVPFSIPDFPQRQTCWQGHLTAAGLSISARERDALAARFRLSPEQIASAVAAAHNQALWHSASHPTPQPSLADLFAAARAQSGQDLGQLTCQLQPRYRWQDIVLPSDPLAQLEELCDRAQYRHLVYGTWGFDRKLSLGKGLNALFSGPPGTGKTMAAEVIANELGLDLYKIDLSQVVSKYIGETEKNLDRIFKAAETANAILFFDEADALFGKRSEVKDAHDRYANIEIGYLLQKMEEYEGTVILATNLSQNLDQAFLRRLAFTVHFPSPDEAHRRRIWAGIWPPELPLGGEVDLDFLARQFKLSGGNIKNIALAAAFLAARAGGPVSMEHLLQATKREYQKMGKVLSEPELTGERRTSQS